jgi:formylglycine-generating enzyme required for sulfatase activity
VLTDEAGVVLVLIPGGKFWMGASADPDAAHNHDPLATPFEGPVHEVTLSPYFLSKYELTQEQWSRFTGRKPSYYKYPGPFAPTPMHPVEQVSWTDATRELPRMGLALPSEAQWENACRAGTETPWHFGADREAIRGKVNLADQAAGRMGAQWPSIQDWPDLDDGSAVHAPVGTYPANRWGLHEMHGSLWEWCQDGFQPRYYARSPKTDPVAPWEVEASCVVRGGGFTSAAALTRSSSRDGKSPSTAGSVYGLRPARAVSE